MTQINWKRKNVKTRLNIKESNNIPYFTFPLFEETGMVTHGFSTRMGGVSEGCYTSLNFAFTKGDYHQNVMENYERMAEALSVNTRDMVLAHQTHTTNIRNVSKKDAGKGLYYQKDYTDIDGLITDVPGITLVTLYADCVPLYFFDPVKKAIGLSHSGWRGTVGGMAQHTVNQMVKEFGSQPNNLLVGIGPSICQECYEISEDVACQFQNRFPDAIGEQILKPRENSKYQLDLWRANQMILLESGILPEHIQTTDICTCCNSEYLFSHRKMGNQRGNLAAFLTLKI